MRKTTTAELVEMVLEHSEPARRDNRILLFEVYARCGLELTPEQWKQVHLLPQPETVRRKGCKIKNDF